MKRVIIMLVVLVTISMCGCGKAEANNYRLRALEQAVSHAIYVDTRTGVQYLQLYRGGVCVMVDAEGKPLIWEGSYDKNSSR